MNDAEKMIVMYANQTLYNLSHGRMRLELKKDSQRAAPNKIDKALDLVVYDEATGNQAISVDMVSGSQKFRIAISLAMAIGKHTRGTGRGVESVIIDEGFGSLDKAGRDDMILELSQLSQVLSRVIVVSHQEEIASAFSNRYCFELVDGSTQVSFMLSDE
jgi:DNA repair protein SbcC/Rad50